MVLGTKEKKYDHSLKILHIFFPSDICLNFVINMMLMSNSHGVLDFH